MRRKKVNKILSVLLLLLFVVVISIFYITYRQSEDVRYNAQTVSFTAEVISLSTAVELSSYDYILAVRDYINRQDPVLKVRINENQLVRYEAGVNKPCLSHAVKIAEFYGAVTISELKKLFEI